MFVDQGFFQGFAELCSSGGGSRAAARGVLCFVVETPDFNYKIGCSAASLPA